MKKAIIYITLRGHSQKIATYLSTKTNLPLFNLNDNPDLSIYPVLFLVSGIYGGESKQELLDYFKNNPSQTSQKMILLTSSVVPKPQGSLCDILSKNGYIVESQQFFCPGSFLFIKLGHPNQIDLANALQFIEPYLN